MFALAVEMDAASVHHNLIGLRGALDEELDRAFREIGAVVVSAAKASHPYRDQSGNLTRKTRAYAPTGRFLRDTLAVEVIANAPYAAHVAVHYREDWIARAFADQDGRIEHELDTALTRAITTANFR